MANLRPFVLLGSAGSLAALRSLGFQTFEPLVKEGYDRSLERELRVRLALREVQRLAESTASGQTGAWAATAAAAVHNARHLACGGLRKVMAAHALETVRLARDLARRRRRRET